MRIDRSNTGRIDAFILERFRGDDLAALSYFPELQSVTFVSGMATDARLASLARLFLTNLTSISLWNSPQVTDQGLAQLAHFPKMKSMMLRGIPLTDAACSTLATQLKPVTLGIQDSKLTFRGCLQLVQSVRLEHLGMSAGSLSQEELLQLIQQAGPSLIRLELKLTPSQEKSLNLSALAEAAERKDIWLFVVRDLSASPLTRRPERAVTPAEREQARIYRVALSATPKMELGLAGHWGAKKTPSQLGNVVTEYEFNTDGTFKMKAHFTHRLIPSIKASGQFWTATVSGSTNNYLVTVARSNWDDGHATTNLSRYYFQGKDLWISGDGASTDFMRFEKKK